MLTALREVDHYDPHGGIVPDAPDAPEIDDARRLARAIVGQAVEDLASWSRELREDVEEWIDSLNDDVGSVTWCAWVLGHASDELLITEVRERAHGLTLRRYVRRREAEGEGADAQAELPL